MNVIDIINHHTTIRNTVGYDFISKIEPYDIKSVMEFLTIVDNYNRMKELSRRN